jgi:hypothetical protein
MSEDSQAASSGEKQYWHDRRLEASRAVASSTGQMADQVRRQGNQPAAGPVVTPLPLRTISKLRHPVAAFVLVIVAVIFVGVGVMAALVKQHSRPRLFKLQIARSRAPCCSVRQERNSPLRFPAVPGVLPSFTSVSTSFEARAGQFSPWSRTLDAQTSGEWLLGPVLAE